jgi:hypothetical protein
MTQEEVEILAAGYADTQKVEDRNGAYRGYLAGYTACLKEREWIEINTEEMIYPADGEKCYFYVEKFGAIAHGKFFMTDSFNRKFVFISDDGAHFPINTVTHYIPMPLPSPPQK